MFDRIFLGDKLRHVLVIWLNLVRLIELLRLYNSDEVIFRLVLSLLRFFEQNKFIFEYSVLALLIIWVIIFHGNDGFFGIF